MQENYRILGISENASDEELEQAYKTLKAKYREERFLEGEAGNEAAKKLTQVETAYAEIKAAREQKKGEENSDFDFSEVEAFLKAGNISAAQEKLDNYNDRNAEWHYLQSVVFYKKNWTNESKKQLEIAMNMEPTNKKYSEAYTKLKEKIEFTEKQFKSGNTDFGGNTAGQPAGEKQMGGDACGSMMNFCTTLCCMDMLCSCCCR